MLSDSETQHLLNQMVMHLWDYKKIVIEIEQGGKKGDDTLGGRLIIDYRYLQNNLQNLKYFWDKMQHSAT